MSGSAPSGINYGGGKWGPGGSHGAPTPVGRGQAPMPVAPIAKAPARTFANPVNNPRAMTPTVGAGSWGMLNPSVFRGMR
jgi:hypothetical protein